MKINEVKTTLSAKILISFLLVSVAGIGMLIIANSFYVDRGFESYIRFKVMNNLNVFSQSLADFYKSNGGWNKLVGNPALWDSIITKNWPNDLKSIENYNGDEFIGSKISIATEVAYSALPTRQDPGNSPNLTLFDTEKKRLVGKTENPDELSVVDIKVAGQTVGWIGIAFGEKLFHPLDQIFWKKKIRALFVTAGWVLLISITTAFFLIKHFLTPIQKLSEATDSLAERNFKIRITNFPKDELGNLAKRFNMMVEKLESYEQKQHQWLSDISHELRTPLSILIAEIDAIQDGIRRPDRKALSSLRDEIIHLKKTVDDLHYISLSEAGTIPVELEAVKPLPILSQAIYFFKTRMGKNDMSVDFQLDLKAVDLQIMGDRKGLLQLFSNLLENSLKHTDRPGKLAIHHTQKCGDLRIVFEDTGPGVTDEALSMLFNRLYRADPARNKNAGGSGLGLAICKAIVEHQKGKILAQHSKYGGVKIEIVLPLIEGQPLPPDIPERK